MAARGDSLTALEALPLPWDDPAFCAEARALLSFSAYAADILQRYPSLVTRRWREGAMRQATAPLVLESEGDDEASSMRALRQSRHLGQLEILWRDVTGVSDVDGTLRESTLLADTLIAAALEHARSSLARFGSPRTRDGRPQDLIIFGLGKLGGPELNYSSDVDLVYAYGEAGETDGRRAIDCEEYFRRLGTALSRLLTQVTEDGFCYRVDLRLRPYGTAGRIALSANAMEQYFEREGRSWERYAWIKARPIAGDIDGGEEILAALRPFVYRRYLDYGAFDALRRMKAMIRDEVARRDLRDHIKLGSGGIREVEFFAQAFQLIRGGREPKLRTRSLLAALAALEELGEISAETRSQLEAAYRFLRRLENRFQQVADEQTHCPPKGGTLRDAIAASVGLPDWAAVEEVWARHRGLVSGCFETVFEIDDEPDTTPRDRWTRAWLESAGLDDATRLALEGFRATAAIRHLSKQGRQRLDRLMPLLLREVDALPHGRRRVAMERVLEVVESVARRSTYLALMTEQDEVRRQLVSLCARSRWITDRLAHHPLMLDELIDRRVAHTAGSVAEQVERRLESAAGDLELEMEVLREVRDSRSIRTAVDFLDGGSSAEEASWALAETVDALLVVVHRLARRDLCKRHGVLGEGVEGLAIVGYGTLGGRELAFDSDLDLVFLYADVDGARETDGPRPIDALTFYTRLSQRILHLATTQTASGRLFEVDTRLRPNGRSGLLVTSVSAFRSYQEEKAWTWELQALSRARCVAGDERVAAAFEDVRARVLGRVRNPGELAAEIVEMREKMRPQLDRGGNDRFDLKHGRGGRVDIEFLTQYARLRWAAENPDLIPPRGTLAGLRALAAAGHLAADEVGALINAFETYRRIALEHALEQAPTLLPADALAGERAAVVSTWDRLLGEAGPASALSGIDC